MSESDGSEEEGRNVHDISNRTGKVCDGRRVRVLLWLGRSS
jgi:hypothetical protein